MSTGTMVERHEHKAPQCHTKDAICKEPACAHDHDVAADVEVSCTPKQGSTDRFDCVHSKPM
ncbi:MAG: hypothetical protein WBG27_03980 [Candidatus Aquilonibacter sp.]|jgi:hypothetical protein